MSLKYSGDFYVGFCLKYFNCNVFSFRVVAIVAAVAVFVVFIQINCIYYVDHFFLLCEISSPGYQKIKGVY